MASSIGIGNFNTESVELNSSALNLHNRIQVDPSLITGNDIYVAPTGGLTDNGPYEFTLSGDSSFHKILNLSRLFGEFHLINPTTGELIDETADVSFVNNIGHSWISSIELFFNDKNVIDQSTQSYAYKSFIENCLSYSNHKKESDFSGSYWVNDDDNFDKYKRADSEALEKRRKLLEGDKFSKGYFAVNLNIDAFKSPIYLFPGINIKLKIHKAKDDFFLMSDGKKAVFRIKKLNMRFRLVQAQESFLNQAKAVGLGTTSPAFIPFTQTKIRSYLCVKEISSFNWTNCIRGVIPHQVIVAFVDHQAYTGNFQKNPFAFQNFGVQKINLKVNGQSYPATPYNVDIDNGDFMDIYDDMLRSIGFSEINESAGITKSEFRSHKFFTIFGKYFRIIIIIFGLEWRIIENSSVMIVGPAI